MKFRVNLRYGTLIPNVILRGFLGGRPIQINILIIRLPLQTIFYPQHASERLDRLWLQSATYSEQKRGQRGKAIMDLQ